MNSCFFCSPRHHPEGIWASRSTNSQSSSRTRDWIAPLQILGTTRNWPTFSGKSGAISEEDSEIPSQASTVLDILGDRTNSDLLTRTNRSWIDPVSSLRISLNYIMPAISHSPLARNGIARRDNWAGQEPGVILVFCIVFLVGCGILLLIIQRALKQRREERAQWEVTEIRDEKSR